MEKYRIICRYEYFAKSGLTWTNWFQEMFTPIADTEEELKDVLKKCKENAKQIEKASKRKSEFKIEKFDYVEVKISDMKNLPKAVTKHRKKK